MLSSSARHQSFLLRPYTRTQCKSHSPRHPLNMLHTEPKNSLHGTVQPHKAYILIHSPIHPSDFPSRISTTLQRALQLKVTKWGGIVNFAWYPDEQQQMNLNLDLGSTQSGRSRSPSYDSTAFRSQDMEVPSTVSVFTRHGNHMGRIDIPNLRVEDVDKAEELIKSFVDGDTTIPRDAKFQVDLTKGDEIHLLVCTHGARDCRCGTTGGQVFEALKEEVERRKSRDVDGVVQRVKVGAVSHVGGHAYAANALILPYGEWLGYLKPENVSIILESVLQLPSKAISEHDAPLLPQHWRGRTGLSKGEQVHLYNTHSPS